MSCCRDYDNEVQAQCGDGVNVIQWKGIVPAWTAELFHPRWSSQDSLQRPRKKSHDQSSSADQQQMKENRETDFYGSGSLVTTPAARTTVAGKDHLLYDFFRGRNRNDDW